MSISISEADFNLYCHLYFTCLEVGRAITNSYQLVAEYRESPTLILFFSISDFKLQFHLRAWVGVGYSPTLYLGSSFYELQRFISVGPVLT